MRYFAKQHIIKASKRVKMRSMYFWSYPKIERDIKKFYLKFPKNEQIYFAVVEPNDKWWKTPCPCHDHHPLSAEPLLGDIQGELWANVTKRLLKLRNLFSRKSNRFPYHNQLKSKSFFLVLSFTSFSFVYFFFIYLKFLSFDSPYRSTCSIPNVPNGKAPDSPRSTRSAPWMRSQQRGLFGINSSPKSVRSASTRVSAPVNSRLRSSSVESHSSNDSRSGKKHRHRSRRTSDNESEMSRGSGRSGRSHNSHRKHRRHRSKHRRTESGSDNESRDRSYSNHRKSSGSTELIDSGHQWREVQRKQAEINASSVQKASVIKSSMVTKSHGQDSNHRSRRHKKHRSPSEKIWSSELTKHLQFDLVDTTGMSEDQLKEIPYTKVETNRLIKRTSGTLKVHKTSHSNSNSNSNSNNNNNNNNSSNNNNNNNNNTTNNNRIDRIREYPKDANGNESVAVNGSIRSASTISSSRDYDRNSGLIRWV